MMLLFLCTPKDATSTYKLPLLCLLLPPKMHAQACFQVRLLAAAKKAAHAERRGGRAAHLVANLASFLHFQVAFCTPKLICNFCKFTLVAS